MKKASFLFFLWWGIVSCGKIELPDTPDPSSPHTQVEIKDTLTLKEALNKEYHEMVAVKGYLVGYCSGTSLHTATIGLPPTPNSNFILASSPTPDAANDYFMIVGLNKSQTFHSDWNLYDHPQKLGSYLLVYGKLQPYFGIKGIKEPKKIAQLPLPKEKEKDTDPTTRNDTLSVSQLLSTEINRFVAVKGYIVGTVMGTHLRQAVFTPPTSSITNLLIADKATEKDLAKIAPIGLKNKSEERQALDLFKHPELLGKEIIVEGITSTYFHVTGIKQLVSYRIQLSDSTTIIDPKKTDSTHWVTPTISDSSALIRQGRSK